MKYVLLLRGINVGGRNKVSMADLKDAIASLGYENVITYTNSGNIIFDTTDNIDIVNEKISQKLNYYSFKINKVILTKEEYIEELKNLPSWWNDDFYRKDVLQMAWYSIHQIIHKPMNRNFYVEFLSLTLSLIAQYSY